MSLKESDFFSKNRRALAKWISAVEDRLPEGLEFLQRHYHRVGHAFRIGITGPPGGGKSTLINALLRVFRARYPEETIAVVAVDPSSHLSGGALLGDRIRMDAIGLDEGIFMRSMASRGSLGGVSEATADICDLLDIYGFDRIFIETVGIGQLELDIISLAHTNLLVLSPECGDEIQAIKSGIVELVDIFVVNKADRQGAGRMVNDLEYMLGLRVYSGEDWRPAVVSCVATGGSGEGADGVFELVEKVESHRSWLQARGRWGRKNRRNLERKLRQNLFHYLQREFDFLQPLLEQKAEEVEKKRLSFSEALEILLEEFSRQFSSSLKKRKGG